MFKYKLSLFFALCAFFFSCNNHHNKALTIVFSADSSKIVISNIELAALLQVKNNIKTDTLYQKLVSVLVTPAENDSTSMEREYAGILTMNGDALEFTPDSAFVRGKSYLVETILNASFGDVEKLVKGKARTNMNFKQQLLKR